MYQESNEHQVLYNQVYCPLKSVYIFIRNASSSILSLKKGSLQIYYHSISFLLCHCPNGQLSTSTRFTCNFLAAVTENQVLKLSRCWIIVFQFHQPCQRITIVRCEDMYRFCTCKHNNLQIQRGILWWAWSWTNMN